MRKTAGVLLMLFAAIGCSTTSREVERIADFGTKMARQGLWREAEFRWRQALAMDPNDYRLLCNLGVAAETRGAFDEALKFYERALQIRPGDKAVKYNYEKVQAFIESQHPDDE